MKKLKWIFIIATLSVVISLFGLLLEYYHLNYKNMANPVWGQLEKAQDDDETIEEAIARLIAEHETDAGAHTGAGESLETHKAQDVIDHKAESILNDKLHIPTRAYTAVVGTGLLVDFTDIQEAIDFVSGEGGGSIYLVSGTYDLPNILTIPTNIKIIGQSRETVFLDCSEILDATKNATFNPTVLTGDSATLTNGSKTVTGSGTSWLTDGLQAGDTVYDTENDYEENIATIDSDTQITLDTNWTGPTATHTIDFHRKGNITKTVTGSGTSWLTDGLQAGNYIKFNADGIYFEIETVDSDTQITLLDSYDETGGTGLCTTQILPRISAGKGYTIYSTGTITITKDSKTVTGSGTSWVANATAGQTILINGAPYIIDTVDSDTQITLVDYFRGESGAGLYYQISTFIENITLKDFNIINCEENGAVYFRSVSNSIIENVEIHGCDTGFYLSYCNNVTLQRSDSSNNMFDTGSSGMWLTQSTRCNILYNNISGNYFNGITTQSANFFCNILSNTVSNNGSSGIGLSALGGAGFGNTISNNKCIGNDESGLYVSNSNYTIVTNNVCSQNGKNGIQISLSDYCIIKGNQSFSNEGGGIETFVSPNISNRCIFGDNVCFSNTTYGIIIATGCVKNIVTSNILYSNGTNFTDNGTSTTSDNNIIS